MKPGACSNTEKEKGSEDGARDDVTDNDNGVSNERGNVDQRGQDGLLVDLEHAPPTEVSVVGPATLNARQATDGSKRKKRRDGKVPKAGKPYLRQNMQNVLA